jgi:hypothetical protein
LSMIAVIDAVTRRHYVDEAVARPPTTARRQANADLTRVSAVHFASD